jgi:hypothetical protein
MSDDLEHAQRSLLMLAQAPESQIAKEVRVRLAMLAITPDADEMKAILDDCAKYSLASDFAMVAMDAVWHQLKAKA